MTAVLVTGCTPLRQSCGGSCPYLASAYALGADPYRPFQAVLFGSKQSLCDDYRQVLLILRRPQLNNINSVIAIVTILNTRTELARASALPPLPAFAALAATVAEMGASLATPLAASYERKGSNCYSGWPRAPPAIAVVLIGMLEDGGDSNAADKTTRLLQFFCSLSLAQCNQRCALYALSDDNKSRGRNSSALR